MHDEEEEKEAVLTPNLQTLPPAEDPETLIPQPPRREDD